MFLFAKISEALTDKMAYSSARLLNMKTKDISATKI